jgi:hypothetical protein
MRRADARGRPHASALVARAPQRGVTARPTASYPARRRVDGSGATAPRVGHGGPRV